MQRIRRDDEVSAYVPADLFEHVATGYTQKRINAIILEQATIEQKRPALAP